MPEIQYTIVESVKWEELCSEVERLTREGWQLHGPMTPVANRGSFADIEPVRYIQAMVKEVRPERIGFFARGATE